MKFYAVKFCELKFLAKVKFDAANSIARILRFEILNLRIPLPRRVEFALYPLKLQPRYPLAHPFELLIKLTRVGEISLYRAHFADAYEAPQRHSRSIRDAAGERAAGIKKNVFYDLYDARSGRQIRRRAQQLADLRAGAFGILHRTLENFIRNFKS